MQRTFANCTAHGVNRPRPSFSDLPVEVRQRIWELTWPPSRVVELCFRDNPDFSRPCSSSSSSPSRVVELSFRDNPDWSGPCSTSSSFSGSDEDLRNPAEFDCLEVAGRYCAWRQGDCTIRDQGTKRLERCRNPVALQVCRESRLHTLSKYTRLQHLKLDPVGFYLNPYRDLLWLDHDTDTENMCGLGVSYGYDLGKIKMIMVAQDGLWANEVNKVAALLRSFTGLRLVRVILENRRSRKRGRRRAPASELYRQAARDLRQEDKIRLPTRDWEVEYVDIEGNVYCQLSFSKDLVLRRA